MTLTAEIAALHRIRRLQQRARKIAAADARFQATVDSGEWARRAEVENRHKGPWIGERAK